MTGIPIEELEKLAAGCDAVCASADRSSMSVWQAGFESAHFYFAQDLRALIARHRAPWDGRAELKPAALRGVLLDDVPALVSGDEIGDMVLVPKEPTDAMLKSGAVAFYGSTKDVLAARLPETYRAMLAAAKVRP